MSWFVYNSNGKLLQSLVVSDNAVTNAKMADDAIGVAELSASGTASSSTFLRGDNAWAAPGGGPSQATQLALEAETNEDTYAAPDLIKHSPGVAKAYCKIAPNGASFDAAYNISSVHDLGVGNRHVHMTTAFSSADWVPVTSNGGSVGNVRTEAPDTSSSVQLLVYDSSDTLSDAGDTHFAGFGDQ